MRRDMEKYKPKSTDQPGDASGSELTIEGKLIVAAAESGETGVDVMVVLLAAGVPKDDFENHASDALRTRVSAALRRLGLRPRQDQVLEKGNELESPEDAAPGLDVIVG